MIFISNSVDPCVTINTQGSFGSANRDEEFECPANSWRTRVIELYTTGRTDLLKQQIANNRKLIDSIRSRRNSTLSEFPSPSENITNSVKYTIHDNR